MWYSGASLSERHMSVMKVRDVRVLVYTATSDSDGTLGGLQRQGLVDRIAPTIRGQSETWSGVHLTPVHRGMTAARESHSMAACHACCLAPETSCEHFNKFLDRGMLIDPRQPRHWVLQPASPED